MITARADTGGGPKHVYDLVRTLKSKSDLEIFISSPAEGEFYPLYKDLAMDFYEIPHRGLSLKKIWGLYQFCKKNKIRCVHSHGRGAGYYSRLLKLLSLGRYRVIHSFHGVHTTSNLAGWLKINIDRVLSLLTDQYIAVSEGEKQKALAMHLAGPWTGESKIQVVYNGIDIDTIQSQRLIRASDPEYVIGTLARLDYQKGIDILIERFEFFFERHPQASIKVLVAGGGDELQNLKEKIKSKNIILLGSRSDPVCFLNEIDLYISFSRGEGLPLSVLEAMAVGCPILLSDVTGHQEFGVTLFQLNSYEDFEKKLLFFFNGPKNKVEYSILKQKFSLEKMAESVIQVYKKELN